MDKICISGGMPLEGVIPIGGAKNAALPLMAASPADRRDRWSSTNVPDLADIATMANLLVQHGVAVAHGGRRRARAWSGHVLELSARAHHLDDRAL